MHRPLLALLLLVVAGCSDSSSAVEQDAASDTLPGDAPDAVAPGPRVVINEIYTAGVDDWVELFNAGDATADLDGWIFRDDDPTHAYTFPPATTLAAGAYLLVVRGEGGFDFGLGDADSALVYDGDTLVDGVTWLAGEIPPERSFGRLPDGTGPFTALFAASPGAANPANPVVTCGDGALGWTERCDGDDFGGTTCASLGFSGGALACVGCETIDTSACEAPSAPVVINEVTSAGDDQIELLNRTDASIDLSGWSLRDDNDNVWTFPSGRTIEAGAYLVLVKGIDHDFGVGSDDLVALRDADGAAIDLCDWQEGDALISFCRQPDAVGGFAPCPASSFGAPNP